LLLVVTEKMPLALQTSGNSNNNHEKHSHPSCQLPDILLSRKTCCHMRLRVA
jgi:hypothetical protein